MKTKEVSFTMKQGDFTQLAKAYVNRVGYSIRALRMLAGYVGAYRDDFRVADVGAGTGKLTENLVSLGLNGFAIEPNDAMREEGTKQLSGFGDFEWRAGSGEETGLPDNSVNWVFMASSFHWTKQDVALREFRRILKPGGFFTCLWNPRDLESSELHTRIEKVIYDMAPGINRVSSGSKKYTADIEKTLLKDGIFGNLTFIEAPHEQVMEKERYMGAWRSVNDIQAQVGVEKFQDVLKAIENEIADLDQIIVPYKTRAWTVQSLP